MSKDRITGMVPMESLTPGQIQVATGPSGRRRSEFLVHFQGWNSTWDRCSTTSHLSPLTCQL